jgi:hypothetical protein
MIPKLVAFMCLISTLISARPVSYPGAWTSSFNLSPDHKKAVIHYSPSAKYSIGYHVHNAYENLNAHYLQVNSLVKRWNKRFSQANLYLYSGAGLWTQGSTHNGSSYIGGSVDWETQRIFTSLTTRLLRYHGHDLGSIYKHQARIGLAPYIGDYGDLHTWIMLEAYYHSIDTQTIHIHPVLRFFTGVHLIELSISPQKELGLFYIHRF